jgi:hypothetical protein
MLLASRATPGFISRTATADYSTSFLAFVSMPKTMLTDIQLL